MDVFTGSGSMCNYSYCGFIVQFTQQQGVRADKLSRCVQGLLQLITLRGFNVLKLGFVRQSGESPVSRKRFLLIPPPALCISD